MLWGLFPTQRGRKDSTQLEAQAKIPLSIGVACEGPAQCVRLLLPFDKDLKQYWGLTRLEFRIESDLIPIC